jgi:hypothetical protein
VAVEGAEYLNSSRRESQGLVSSDTAPRCVARFEIHFAGLRTVLGI